MIRPEVKTLLQRWRELFAGLIVLMLGSTWVFDSYGLLYYLGYPVSLTGLVLIWIGIQRGRFRTPANGVGVVTVDEGQIVYMGPLTGGTSVIADLERLTLIRTVSPPHWRLDGRQDNSLLIPVNASGADALFDAFSTLPGLRTERMLSELNSTGAQAIVIWERHALRPAHATLH